MSDLGSLSQCLVESDTEANQRAHRLRRKALAISIVLEMLLVAALLLWPLFMPGTLPARFIVTPLLPYHGDTIARKPNEVFRRQLVSKYLPPLNSKPLWQPKQIPSSAEANASEPPETYADTTGNATSDEAGAGIGPLIDGGSDNRNRIIQVPPPAKPHAKPQFVSEGVMAAALVRRVLPVYPPSARVMHVTGDVRLRAIIANDGSVRELTLLSGNPLLAQSAMAAVREWRYRPAILDGEAVAVETYITVNFVMGEP